MKLLSVAIPCYNSEAYMSKCINSLLIGGEEVEIIIVDDGSSDRTAEIADDYAEKYPTIVKAIHQENGGHGQAVNTGIKNATGLYFKVVDSDDWLDEAAFHKLMSVLRFWCRTKEEKRPDLVVCNYVYDHLEEGKTKAVRYGNLFPEQKICRWDEIGCFSPEQYLVMHALIFRTGVLYDCGLKLPEHTFYVDNLFANCPLPFVQRIYYLYHYYLGREDQSVNEKVLVSRIDQQILVTQLGNRFVGSDAVQNTEPKLRRYLYRNSSIMMAISTVHLLMLGKEGRQRRKKLWQSLKKENPKLYRRLRLGSISGLTCLPGAPGAAVVIGGYRMARRIWQFQ